MLLWAFIPWLWRREEPFGWLRPSSWGAAARKVMDWMGRWRGRFRHDPVGGWTAARRGVVAWVRQALGIDAPAPTGELAGADRA